MNALLFTMIYSYTSIVTLGFIFEVVSWNPLDCLVSPKTLRGLGVQQIQTDSVLSLDNILNATKYYIYKTNFHYVIRKIRKDVDHT